MYKTLVKFKGVCFMQITNVMYSKMANNGRMNNTSSPAFGASPIVQGGEKMLAATAAATAAAVLGILNLQNTSNLNALLSNVEKLDKELTAISFNPQSYSVKEIADLYENTRTIYKKLGSYKNNKNAAKVRSKLEMTMYDLESIILEKADSAAQKYVVSKDEVFDGEETDIVDFVFMNKDELEKSKQEVAELLDAYDSINEFTESRDKLVDVEGYIDTSLELDLASKTFDEVVEIYRKLPRMIKKMDNGPQKVNYILVESSIPYEAIVNKRWPDAHNLDEIFGDFIEE